ncbi:MAG TPA: ATP-dependent DNA helicase UvrD2 [Gordonia sp. (in: high G+C Gram-positive bacteria)]|uniref:ATP-dependent helicase n=1 Tax=unclassified Gordonia (in: high G+C Gram-positive bacteria) TaxID=2657482 RepID=UPI000FAB8E45|nr:MULTISPECIES: ATP-dependent DNA helicase UvrD2 [unclassified Gordonia (in: high G+C Gram-positive bacteria)]RTL04425.1 MAG: ATP-dependent DNA helicase UvrD2 [Acidimicrobiia bacterium]HNP56117.1 ATP-dependent DNA helicase UvrD2 [Gordonia sp. (in: high G+C Gram-positive bacteria)]HRC49791.1 ATP-dependent DNA helicase UvrD2 [Gordonia sp. (in: high G+C Gram-positive bacteria)]
MSGAGGIVVGVVDHLADLDPEQLAAVTAPRGPVCVLAGAGTGKTRTITRRIAHLVEGGQVNPDQVLAVTFTARAAGEMRSRLRELGVSGAGSSGVQAQTFHAAALRQLRYFWPRAIGDTRWELIDSKLPIVGRAARRARLATTTEMLRDLASEIEWAKASLIGPSGYAAAAVDAGRDLPAPVEQVAQVFAAYEAAKVTDDGDRLFDFDDLLIYTTQILTDDAGLAEEFRSRYRCFVVDEYQDVTPVQHGLLKAWLGDRDDLTVVGDANQTIYTFAGAQASFLLNFSREYPQAQVVRLVRDYRSTPEVVDLANRVIGAARGRAAGTRLELVGQRPPGPMPRFAEYPDEPAEAAATVADIGKLIAEGVPASEIAVLYRVNAQSQVYEEALTQAQIPYQIRGGDAFFARTEIRQALREITAAARTADAAAGEDLIDTLRVLLFPLGLTPDEPSGAEAKSRWASLSALVELAEDLRTHDSELSLGGLASELASRSAAGHPPTMNGVTLSSLHAAKGLEWDAVFLVGLTDGAVPISHAIDASAEAVEEERRLFYVGVTRAREHLRLSWALARNEGGRRGRRKSRFLVGLLPTCERCSSNLMGSRALASGLCDSCAGVPRGSASARSGVAARAATMPLAPADAALFDSLRQWRAAEANREKKPAFTVFADKTLREIATSRPAGLHELKRVSGVGPAKLERYGDAVVAIVASAAVPAT